MNKNDDGATAPSLVVSFRRGLIRVEIPKMKENEIDELVKIINSARLFLTDEGQDPIDPVEMAKFPQVIREEVVTDDPQKMPDAAMIKAALEAQKSGGTKGDDPLPDDPSAAEKYRKGVEDGSIKAMPSLIDVNGASRAKVEAARKDLVAAINEAADSLSADKPSQQSLGAGAALALTDDEINAVQNFRQLYGTLDVAWDAVADSVPTPGESKDPDNRGDSEHELNANQFVSFVDDAIHRVAGMLSRCEMLAAFLRSMDDSLALYGFPRSRISRIDAMIETLKKIRKTINVLHDVAYCRSNRNDVYFGTGSSTFKVLDEFRTRILEQNQDTEEFIDSMINELAYKISVISKGESPAYSDEGTPSPIAPYNFSPAVYDEIGKMILAFIQLRGGESSWGHILDCIDTELRCGYTGFVDVPSKQTANDVVAITRNYYDACISADKPLFSEFLDRSIDAARTNMAKDTEGRKSEANNEPRNDHS